MYEVKVRVWGQGEIFGVKCSITGPLFAGCSKKAIHKMCGPFLTFRLVTVITVTQILDSLIVLNQCILISDWVQHNTAIKWLQLTKSYIFRFQKVTWGRRTRSTHPRFTQAIHEIWEETKRWSQQPSHKTSWKYIRSGMSLVWFFFLDSSLVGHCIQFIYWNSIQAL